MEADAGQPEVSVHLFGPGVVLDDRGRLAQFSLPGGPSFDVGRRGRPLAAVADSTTRFGFTYDRAGRLSKVSSPSGATTVIYNSAGQVAKLAEPGGSESFTYDSSHHVVAYSDSGGDTAGFAYSQGHLSSAVITLTAVDPSYSFTYSSDGKLASWSERTNMSTVRSDLTVDSAGDVTTVTQGSTTDAAMAYTPRDALRYVTSGAGTLASFTYDGQGRLVTARSASATTSFLYNPAGRLSAVSYPSGASNTTSTLSYDSLGRLVAVAAPAGQQFALVYVPAPAARTHLATNIGKTAATLNGVVNPHGLPAQYRFEFGTTKSYGHLTRKRPAGNGARPVDVAASLGHLAPGTTYHFRLIATSAAGTTVGPDRSLRTR